MDKDNVIGFTQYLQLSYTIEVSYHTHYSNLHMCIKQTLTFAATYTNVSNQNYQTDILKNILVHEGKNI